MTLLSPTRLWWLVAVVALAGAYLLLQRRRRHYAVRFTNLDLLASVAPKRPGWRRHAPVAAMLGALAALVVGLARPARDEDVARDRAVVVLALDVSASMTATDVAPDRLAAAKAAAIEFVQDAPDTYLVGLVSFDGQARLLTMPTTDHDQVVAAIDGLEPGRGTAAGEAIYSSLDAIASAFASADDGSVVLAADEGNDTETATEEPAATVVLLSDGTTTSGRPVEEAVRAAIAADVPVTTIAFGTDAGTVEVQGETVAVPADKVTMRAIADETGGSAFEAASTEELSSVYESIQTRVGVTTEQREIGRWFLGLGIALLVLAAAGSMLWTGRFI